MNLSLTTTPKVIAAICAALLAVLLFCAYKVNTNPSGIALTGFIFSCAALVVIACFTKIDVVLQVLRDELEPKTGNGSGSGSVNAIAPINPYPQRPHRYDIELALVHSLAPHLVNSIKATELGTYIRAATDAILSGGLPAGTSMHKCLIHGSAVCNCGQAYDNPKPIWAMPGLQADQAAEAEIVAAGLTAPRVTADQIQALMASLTWSYEHQEGSRHTFAHAFLGDFYIATGHNAPVSRQNFDASLGMKYAREQAEGKARDKLWELEGYALFKQLA